MPTDNHYLRLQATPSKPNYQKSSMQYRLLKGPLLTLWLGAAILSACHSAKTPVAASSSNESVPPTAKTVPVRAVVVRGKVFDNKDSITVIPGMELIFRHELTGSEGDSSRALTKLDGSYRIELNLGQTYQVALNKDGRKVEVQQYAVPTTVVDSSGLVKNYYSTYSDGCCIDYFGWFTYFDINRAALQPEYLTRVDDLIRGFRQLDSDSIAIVVEGHSEPSEVPLDHHRRERYLMGIGWERAKATCAYLAKNGIPASKLFMISYGAHRPVAPNTTFEERQLNRRAELHMRSLEYLASQDGNRIVAYLKSSLPARRVGTAKLTRSSGNRKKTPVK